MLLKRPLGGGTADLSTKVEKNLETGGWRPRFPSQVPLRSSAPLTMFLYVFGPPFPKRLG